MGSGETPIRLAHVSGQPAPSAIPLYRRLAADPGLDFTVFYGSDDGVAPYDDGYGTPIAWDADLTSGYRCVFLKEAGRTPGLAESFLAARNWDVAPRLLRGRYDAVWLGGYFSATYVMAALAQRARGGQVLLREEQTTLDPRGLGNLMVKQVALRALLRSSYGLYISTENRRWLESFGIPPERLFPAPYTVDNDAFQRAHAALQGRRAELRAAFGIDPAAGPVILTVSRLIPKKQPHLLLEAFRRARGRTRCALLIVGSGPLEAELRALVAEQDIPDVHFAGFLNRSQVAEAYCVADVFTLLSGWRETFGLVVNEAMNFRLPVVVADRVGCAADLVSTGYNGYVVSHRDPEAAGEALTRLAADESLRRRMGAASLERINGWDVERSAAGILQAVRSGVQSRGRPGSSH